MRLFVPTVMIIALVVAGVVEIGMQPSAAERTNLYLIFGSVALGALAIGWWISAHRFRSLRTSLQFVSVASVLVAGSAVFASAVNMFLDQHDLRLVLVALGLGVSLGVVLAIAITRGLTDDLSRLEATVVAVGRGDLDARTGIDRRDEVGATARQVDAMIERLNEAEVARVRDADARKQFLASVSHDLRTPLAALQAAMEAVEDGVADDPKRYFASMSADLSVLSTLIDDLAVLASVDAGGLKIDQLVDLAEILDETVEVMSPLAELRGVRLVATSTGRATARGDAAALARVLRNLTDNALRYAPADSQIGLEVSNGGPHVVVSVTDEGEGFADGLKETAFDRFVTSDAARTRGGGSGLGLAIAHSVVAAHEGEIWIDDTEPKTTVRFRLPAAS